MFLERFVPQAPPDRSCEVGAGDSLLADLLWRQQGSVEGLLITDLSTAMLEHSRRWEPRGAILRKASASELPVADDAMLLLVASLADPYDDHAFWAEVARALAPGGHCVLTTPSNIWADAFRGDGPIRDTAEFELSDGEAVHLLSYVREPVEERRMIEAAGLVVVGEEAVSLAMLEGAISPKISFLKPGDPVVRGFVAERPAP